MECCIAIEKDKRVDNTGIENVCRGPYGSVCPSQQPAASMGVTLNQAE